MELDELRQQWVEHDRKLDENIRLSRQLLRETYTRRARFALWRLAAIVALGSLSVLVILVALGGFIATNISSPRFVWPAVVLDLAAIAALIALSAQVVLALNINYHQPVALIQRRLEMLRKLRIRYAQALCITTPLLWMPIFVVFMKVLFGLDVYRNPGTTWILINVAFGLVFLALGIWLIRKLSPRLSQQFVRDLAGYNLKAASRFLATLAEFESDHSPQERSSIREYSPDE
jgi:MFS family permease